MIIGTKQGSYKVNNHRHSDNVYPVLDYPATVRKMFLYSCNGFYAAFILSECTRKQAGKGL